MKKQCLITEVTDYQTYASVKETASCNPLDSGRATEGLVPVGHNPLEDDAPVDEKK